MQRAGNHSRPQTITTFHRLQPITPDQHSRTTPPLCSQGSRGLCIYTRIRIGHLSHRICYLLRPHHLQPQPLIAWGRRKDNIGHCTFSSTVSSCSIHRTYSTPSPPMPQGRPPPPQGPPSLPRRDMAAIGTYAGLPSGKYFLPIVCYVHTQPDANVMVTSILQTTCPTATKLTDHGGTEAEGGRGCSEEENAG